ncbi:MAG: hypothetical protein NTW26_10995 [bacterium]|nr:hypothetical protein [bacterium]
MNHYSINRYGLFAMAVPGTLAVLAMWRVGVNLFSIFGVDVDDLTGALVFLALALGAGLLLTALFGWFGRLVQQLFFGRIPGSFFLDRASREAGPMKVKLAHGAGHSLDRNFPQTFANAFRNYFKYETANDELRDRLCLSALAEHSAEVRRRLERLEAGGLMRINFAGLFLLYALARLAWILTSGSAFTPLYIVEPALSLLLFLGFVWSYLSLVGVYYHELYLAFFALTVEENVDRPQVRLQTREDDRPRNRHPRRRPDSGGGDRPSDGRDRPQGGNRPSGGGNRPSGGGDRSSGGGNRPPGGRDRNRSSGDRDRSSGGGDRSSDGRDRPPGGDQPPREG